MSPRACPFCAASSAAILDADAHHPVWSLMPPVTLFECEACHSHFTDPLPAAQLLAECYARYAIHGYPAAKAQAKTVSRQHDWYRYIHRRCAPADRPGLRIADVGAGEGHLLLEAAQHHPRASLQAFDFGAPPANAALARLTAERRLSWHRCNLDDGDFGTPNTFDVVYCIAVIEHVRHPDCLLQRLLEITTPGGQLFIFGPLAGSAAQVAMGKNWIYHIPGEHLTVPSERGLRRCLARLGMATYSFVPIWQRYSTRYIATAFWPGLAWFPDVLVPLPTGCFLLSIRKPR